MAEPAAQFIRFESWSVPFAAGVFPREVGAVATSGLSLEYELIEDSDGQCVLRDGELDIEFGSLPIHCNVRATQPGSDRWLPAEPVVATLTADVGGSRTIIISGPTLVQPETWIVTVSDQGGISEYFSTRNDTPAICTAESLGEHDQNQNVSIEITGLASGRCIVLVSGGGFANYDAIGATIDFSITVD